MRLCFERLPGYPSLNQGEDFIQWLESNFPGLDYRYAGYIVQNLGDMWFGQNVLWNILVEKDVDLLAQIERRNWVVDGYVVHAYLRESGQGEYNIANRSFTISREVAESVAAA